MADMEVQPVRLSFVYEASTGSGTNDSVATLSDLVSFGLDSNPAEGLLAIASSLDTLYMSAQDDGVNVLLELDQDSNGSTGYANAAIDYTETIRRDEPRSARGTDEEPRPPPRAAPRYARGRRIPPMPASSICVPRRSGP